MADPIDLDAIAARGRPDPLSSVDVPSWFVLVTTEERDALLAIARWAQDAPHHDNCMADRSDTDPTNYPWPCTCGRDEVMP